MEHQPTVTLESLQGNSPDTVILKVTGPLTVNNFFDFQDLSRKQNAPVLLIDLSGVPFIDSAALGSLVALHVSREHAAKKYALVGAQERVEALFRMIGVGGFLVTYPTLAEAEAALTQQPPARQTATPN